MKKCIQCSLLLAPEGDTRKCYFVRYLFALVSNPFAVLILKQEKLKYSLRFKVLTAMKMSSVAVKS
jgi:hypothetical protein